MSVKFGFLPTNKARHVLYRFCLWTAPFRAEVHNLRPVWQSTAVKESGAEIEELHDSRRLWKLFDDERGYGTSDF